MICAAVCDMTFACGHALSSRPRRVCCATFSPSQNSTLQRSRISSVASAACFGTVSEHAVSVVAPRAETDLHISRDAPRPAGAKRPPRRFNKRPLKGDDDDARRTNALQQLIRPSITSSPNPQATARRILSECSTTHELISTVKALPESCRCGYVATVAFSVAKRLHESDNGRISRKRLRVCFMCTLTICVSFKRGIVIVCAMAF